MKTIVHIIAGIAALVLLDGCASRQKPTASGIRGKGTYQQGVDDGYTLGSSDAAKRLYWNKQALEKRASETASDDKGQTHYYVWEESGTTPDGRKLAPEKVAVPVYEPEPKK